jgi:phage terminase large subunit-like protein
MDLDTLLTGLEELADRRRFNRIDFYEPYPKQMEFHALGATKRARLLRAGNQLGKTFAGAAEMTYHLTGLYPDWWTGLRFDHPIVAWAAGEGALLTRDGPQRLLFGPPGVDDEFGTGFVPRHLIVDRPSMSRGVTDAYDTVQVRHAGGGVSTITFKSYDQGRAKFQTATLHFAWLDEEPPEDIFSEVLARTTATDGKIAITFTPLKGMSNVVAQFLNGESAMFSDTLMTIHDVKHIKNVQDEINKYPAYQREARTMGVPMFGAGRIFPVDEATIIEDTMPLRSVPEHWTKLWGLDFGIGHPFAAVLTAWDKDADVIHVLHGVRMADALTMQHVTAMLPICANAPVAWPQDGTERRDDGRPLAKHYSDFGLLMLDKHATFSDGSISTEAGVLEMHDRMVTGRFKVSQTMMHGDWGNEFRMYHRDLEGKIVKIADDYMSATRVAVMAKRFGKAGTIAGATSFGRSKSHHITQPLAANVDFNVFR